MLQVGRWLGGWVVGSMLDIHGLCSAHFEISTETDCLTEGGGRGAGVVVGGGCGVLLLLGRSWGCALSEKLFAQPMQKMFR